MNDSLSAYVERLERRGLRSKRQKEDDYIAKKNKEIASLEGRVYMFMSKEKQKKERAQKMSHKLELWGFK